MLARLKKGTKREERKKERERERNRQRQRDIERVPIDRKSWLKWLIELRKNKQITEKVYL